MSVSCHGGGRVDASFCLGSPMRGLCRGGSWVFLSRIRSPLAGGSSLGELLRAEQGVHVTPRV